MPFAGSSGWRKTDVPVQRFDEHPDPATLWRPPGDPRIAQKMRWLSKFVSRLAPPKPAPGIRKFRSIEEADRDREQRSATHRTR